MTGQELRTLRLRQGLTQREVAAAAGMRQPDLSAVEHGRRGGAETHARVRSAIRSLARPSRALDPQMRRELLAAFARYGASNVRVFGSAARGEDRPGSDLDLMARFPAGTDLFDLMNLESELEDLLGLPVDVVADSPTLRHELAAAQREAVAL